jgi:hypothetical protein
MLRKLDAWILNRFQSLADNITLRTGVTSLEVARDILLVNILGAFFFLFTALFIFGLGWEQISSEIRGDGSPYFRIVLFSVLLLFCALRNFEDWKNLKRAAHLWRQAWERNEIPARPPISPTAGIWYIRLSNFIVLPTIFVYMLLAINFEVRNAWELGFISTLMLGILFFCLWPIANYFEAVIPRRPGSGKKKAREVQLPQGAIAVSNSENG